MPLPDLAHEDLPGKRHPSLPFPADVNVLGGQCPGRPWKPGVERDGGCINPGPCKKLGQDGTGLLPCPSSPGLDYGTDKRGLLRDRGGVAVSMLPGS